MSEKEPQRTEQPVLVAFLLPFVLAYDAVKGVLIATGRSLTAGLRLVGGVLISLLHGLSSAIELLLTVIGKPLRWLVDGLGWLGRGLAWLLRHLLTPFVWLDRLYRAVVLAIIESVGWVMSRAVALVLAALGVLRAPLQALGRLLAPGWQAARRAAHALLHAAVVPFLLAGRGLAVAGRALLTALRTAGRLLIEAPLAALAALARTITNAVARALGVIARAVATASRLILRPLQVTVDAIIEAINRAWERVLRAVAPAWDTACRLAVRFWRALLAPFRYAARGIARAWHATGAAVRRVVRAAATTVTAPIRRMRGAVRARIDAIRTAVRDGLRRR